MDYLDWMDMAADEELGRRHFDEFREYRPRVMTPRRNYEPRELFAHPLNSPRVSGSSTDKPPVDLSPATMARGRESSLKKRRKLIKEQAA